MSEDKSDIPDTPPEVLAKQSRSRALTGETAQLLGAKDILTEDGKVSDATRRASAVNAAAKDARQRAEAFAGGSPHAGLTIAAVAEIKGQCYEAEPKMNPETGDRTEAFVNWLWATHPHHAKVRYAYRDVWPTALPKAWPPKLKPGIGTLDTVTAFTANLNAPHPDPTVFPRAGSILDRIAKGTATAEERAKVRALLDCDGPASEDKRRRVPSRAKRSYVRRQPRQPASPATTTPSA